jgi:hypothetical protein
MMPKQGDGSLITEEQRLTSLARLLFYPTGKSMTTDPTEAASPTKLALL